MKNIITIPQGINMQEIQRNMKRMVKKAIRIIQEESHQLVAESKTPYNLAKGEEDFVTNGDKLAQEMYVGEIRAVFPTFGIIAEEKELVVPSTHPGHEIYFTIDPLDGTKAYKRKQSQGVGTMIALVCDGTPIAAYIGDANTGNIYGYTEGVLVDGIEVERERFGKVLPLKPELTIPLRRQYGLLRDTVAEQPSFIQKMICNPKDGGLLKDYEIQSGSVGMIYTRLWNGEAGMLVTGPTFATPWDMTPTIAISLKLGFRFFRMKVGDYAFVEYQPKLISTVEEYPYTDIVVHDAHVAELLGWIA